VAVLGSIAASAAASMAASTASKQADGAHRGFFCGHHAAPPPHFCASPAHALRETSHAGCSCGPTMTSHACARAWAAPARAWASADWDCPPPEECHAQDTSRGRSLHAPWQNPCLRLHDRAPLDWTDERRRTNWLPNTLRRRKWFRPPCECPFCSRHRSSYGYSSSFCLNQT
jgi:hypothetical protein